MSAEDDAGAWPAPQLPEHLLHVLVRWHPEPVIVLELGLEETAPWLKTRTRTLRTAVATPELARDLLRQLNAALAELDAKDAAN